MHVEWNSKINVHLQKQFTCGIRTRYHLLFVIKILISFVALDQKRPQNTHIQKNHKWIRTVYCSGDTENHVYLHQIHTIGNVTHSDCDCMNLLVIKRAFLKIVFKPISTLFTITIASEKTLRLLHNRCVELLIANMYYGLNISILNANTC